MNSHYGKVCDYCGFNMIIPRKYLYKYIEKHTKSLYKIEGLCRVSDLANDYVSIYHQNIYQKINHYPTIHNNYNLIQQFLHHHTGTKESSDYRCDLCSKNSCNFHFIYSNFIFHKCNDCQQTTVICGWCQEETPSNYYCIKCDNDKEQLFIE